MELGASQSAIAEHAKPTLSDEQQRVLTQSLVNLNTTNVHGVTISTVLLRYDFRYSYHHAYEYSMQHELRNIYF